VAPLTNFACSVAGTESWQPDVEQTTEGVLPGPWHAAQPGPDACSATASTPSAVAPWQPSVTHVPVAAWCFVPMLWNVSGSVWHCEQSVEGLGPAGPGGLAWQTEQFGGVIPVHVAGTLACSVATLTPVSDPWQALLTQMPGSAVCDASCAAWRGVMSMVWQVVQSSVSVPVRWQGVQPGPFVGALEEWIVAASVLWHSEVTHVLSGGVCFVPTTWMVPQKSPVWHDVHSAVGVTPGAWHAAQPGPPATTWMAMTSRVWQALAPPRSQEVGGQCGTRSRACGRWGGPSSGSSST